MLDLLQKFEKIIYIALVILLAIVVIFSVIELGYLVFFSLINNSIRLGTYDLLNLLGLFLLVLIGVELLDTIRVYIEKNEIHVEVIVLLAIIAVARKVIILDPTALDYSLLVGLGVLFFALAAGYYLIKRAGNPFKDWGIS